MTDRFERRLPEILTWISAPQVPDYTDDILGLTARRRQRPGWTFPGRWLPMDIAVPQQAVARTQWRPIGIVILLILALAAAALVYIGSRPRLAPFYGPAANGSLVYVRDGDIYIADANLESERLLIGGPENETVAGWSNDGATLLFGRVVPGGSVVMAADADGQNVRRLNSNVVSATTTEAFWISPDNKTMAIISSPRTRRRWNSCRWTAGMNDGCCRSATWCRRGLSSGYRQTGTSWCSLDIRTATSTSLACIASGLTARASRRSPCSVVSPCPGWKPRSRSRT